ncbi:hypothetical protein [Xanthomonas campestris]|jgi:hypothetical protein|uniref:hypothetical protein n=2 Tax=Xanthomonas campestris TaxID=339 RepID=UPI001CBF395D|nr:hypothetical protein [Xanthomonas campestris]MEA9488682.1 hypothetical protein [Xanthomonas campestris]
MPKQEGEGSRRSAERLDKDDYLMNEETRLTEDALPELLGRIWNRVIGQVNALLRAHETFEFFNFLENLNPSLEEVIKGFEFADFALTKFVESGDLEHDEMRQALNAKQCILKMKLLSNALAVQNQDEYTKIMHELKQQAQI